MSGLLWPGDERARDVFSDAAVLAAMVEVERAWLGVLVDAGVAPGTVDPSLVGLVGPDDLPGLAVAAEAGGNAVIPLVALLRSRVDDGTARWLHRGLTSQDVVDTALMLCVRDVLSEITDLLRSQVEVLTTLVGTHRSTPMVGRTLTQHAVPTTFGLKAAGWLTGVLDVHDDLVALRLPAQVGGAAGTRAAVAELGGDPSATAAALADRLGLEAAPVWHTHRRPVTRVGDTLVACTDVWGRIARDVLTLGRPEVGELAEGTGGGSSTMPHKANPVLSTLVRRAALTGPGLASTLHLASADQVDERADGAWHAEWETLQLLARRTHVAAAQTLDLLVGLRVDPARMAANLAAAGDGVRAEQRAMADLVGHAPSAVYAGDTDVQIDAVLARAAPLAPRPDPSTKEPSP